MTGVRRLFCAVWRPSLTALASLLFASCAHESVKLLSAEGPTGMTAAPAHISGVYRIQAGDPLEVSFLDEPQLTQQVRVDWNGRLDLPFFAGKTQPQIPAAGKTPAELGDAIAQLARANDVLKSPRCSVRVLEFADQTFVVYGQVNRPGRYLFPQGYEPKLPIMDAVALAGGYTRLARTSQVYVKRERNVYQIDLRRILTHPGEETFTIQAGDVVTIPERIF